MATSGWGYECGVMVGCVSHLGWSNEAQTGDSYVMGTKDSLLVGQVGRVLGSRAETCLSPSTNRAGNELVVLWWSPGMEVFTVGTKGEEHGEGPSKVPRGPPLADPISMIGALSFPWV